MEPRESMKSSRADRLAVYVATGLKHYLGTAEAAHVLREGSRRPRSNQLVHRLRRALRERLDVFERGHLRSMARHLEGAARPEVEPVERVRARDLSPEDFTRLHHSPGRPLVIEGMLAHTKAVNEWDFGWLAKECGDQRVMVCCSQRLNLSWDHGRVFEAMPLRDALALIQKGDDYYVSGTGDILRSRPELERELEVHRLAKYCAGRERSRPLYTQLFIGARGSGSEYHCAPLSNMFVMIHGQKRWTVLSPKFTPFMEPVTSRVGYHAYSPIDGARSLEDLRAAGHLLYEHTQRYVADLVPGDVFFNPPWWWHRVENTSPTTIGGAIRFPSHHLFSGNPFFMALTLSHMPRQVLAGLGLRLSGKPFTDEVLLETLEARAD